MRLLILTAALLVAGAASAATQREAPPGAPAAPPTLPRVFAQAGYAEPSIPPSACRVVDAGQAACTLPAMTAGRYYARATATSTATADGAAQQVIIVAGGGDQGCTSTYAPDPKAPWSVGARHSFTAGCIFTVVTDTPITVTAVYIDQKATKDPAGPTLAVYPWPWSGVLGTQAAVIKQ